MFYDYCTYSYSYVLYHEFVSFFKRFILDFCFYFLEIFFVMCVRALSGHTENTNIQAIRGDGRTNERSNERVWHMLYVAELLFMRALFIVYS